MALDTAQKRASALNFGNRTRILPFPSGTIGLAQRKHLVGLYSGLLIEAEPGAQVASGELTSPTSTGNQVISGLGFQPACVLFFSSAHAAGSGGDHFWSMLGFSDGANDACHIAHSEDNAGATTFTRRGTSVLNCIFKNGAGSGSVSLAASMVSLDSDGFTINWNTVEGSGIPVQWIALGGNIQNVHVGSFSSGTVSGNLAETGVGFQPDAVLFVGPSGTSLEDFQTISDISIGVGISSTERWATDGATGNNDSPSVVHNALLNNRICAARGSGGTLRIEIDLVSMDSDGFTVNIIDASLSLDYVYLAIQGATLQVAAGTESQPTSAGTKATTGVGFKPEVLFFAGGGATTINTMEAIDRQDVIGVAHENSNRSVSGFDESGVTTFVSSGAASATKCLQFIDGTTPSVVAEAELDSFDNDGFTLDWTTADATARLFGWFALAAPPVGQALITLNKVIINAQSQQIFVSTGDIKVSESELQADVISAEVIVSSQIVFNEAVIQAQGEHPFVSTGEIDVFVIDVDSQSITDVVGTGEYVVLLIDLDASAVLPISGDSEYAVNEIVLEAEAELILLSSAIIILDESSFIANGVLPPVSFEPPAEPDPATADHVLWVDFDDTRWSVFNKLDASEFDNRAFRFQAELSSENSFTNILITRVDVNAEDI